MLTLDAFVLGGLSGPVTTKGAFQRASQRSHPQQCGLSPNPALASDFSFPLPSFDSEIGHLVGTARERTGI